MYSFTDLIDDNVFFDLFALERGVLQLWSQIDGPVAMLTMYPAKKNENRFVIKDYSENAGAFDWLLAEGFVKRVISSPTEPDPVVELHLDKIRTWHQENTERI